MMISSSVQAALKLCYKSARIRSSLEERRKGKKKKEKALLLLATNTTHILNPKSF
jgi:hypothetical protein